MLTGALGMTLYPPWASCLVKWECPEYFPASPCLLNALSENRSRGNSLDEYVGVEGVWQGLICSCLQRTLRALGEGRWRFAKCLLTLMVNDYECWQPTFSASIVLCVRSRPVMELLATQDRKRQLLPLFGPVLLAKVPFQNQTAASTSLSHPNN